ncbi:4Fe-4S binding protein [Xylanibacter ruminicola]
MLILILSLGGKNRNLSLGVHFCTSCSSCSKFCPFDVIYIIVGR